MIIRLSQLLIDFPEIAELDMNPVLIKDGKPVGVDARIRGFAACSVPSPLHLVISPYPEEDESHDDYRGWSAGFLSGRSNPKMRRFLRTCSRCCRPRPFIIGFFGALKELSPRCWPVSPRSITTGKLRWSPWMMIRKQIGCWGLPESSAIRTARTGEFAVLVGDAWQGKGIGSESA